MKVLQFSEFCSDKNNIHIDIILNCEFNNIGYFNRI